MATFWDDCFERNHHPLEVHHVFQLHSYDTPIADRFRAIAGVGDEPGSALRDDRSNGTQPVSASSALGVRVVAVVCDDTGRSRVACALGEKRWNRAAVPLAAAQGLLFDLWQTDN